VRALLIGVRDGVKGADVVAVDTAGANVGGSSEVHPVASNKIRKTFIRLKTSVDMALFSLFSQPGSSFGFPRSQRVSGGALAAHEAASAKLPILRK